MKISCVLLAIIVLRVLTYLKRVLQVLGGPCKVPTRLVQLTIHPQEEAKLRVTTVWQASIAQQEEPLSLKFALQVTIAPSQQNTQSIVSRVSSAMEARLIRLLVLGDTTALVELTNTSSVPLELIALPVVLNPFRVQMELMGLEAWITSMKRVAANLVVVVCIQQVKSPTSV
jgi:hypothetical protein